MVSTAIRGSRKLMSIARTRQGMNCLWCMSIMYGTVVCLLCQISINYLTMYDRDYPENFLILTTVSFGESRK